MGDRITQLSELLRKAADARALAASPIWEESWQALEKHLLDNLLECGPTDDEKRFRLQTAIEVGRTVRRILEAKGATKEQVERELTLLEGAKMRPVA